MKFQKRCLTQFLGGRGIIDTFREEAIYAFPVSPVKCTKGDLVSSDVERHETFIIRALVHGYAAPLPFVTAFKKGEKYQNSASKQYVTYSLENLSPCHSNSPIRDRGNYSYTLSHGRDSGVLESRAPTRATPQPLTKRPISFGPVLVDRRMG